ncbi:hypothetical protein ID866_6803 [Astraeus odoratus]|nr:hypothetical protein ID866_6803 [Astraeus odoratus]
MTLFNMLLVRCILVYEYSYFMVHNKKGANYSEVFPIAVEAYISSKQVIVKKAIEGAIQDHGDDIDGLCQAVIDIAKENCMSKMLLEL